MYINVIVVRQLYQETNFPEASGSLFADKTAGDNALLLLVYNVKINPGYLPSRLRVTR